MCLQQNKSGLKMRNRKKSQTKKIPTRNNAARSDLLQAWLLPNLVCDFLACAQRSLRSRRAQMETIGITIIVVLVLIGVMFGLQFVLKGEPSDVGKIYRQSNLAANFLSALAGTTPYQYDELTFTQYVQKCAEEEPIIGPNCGKTSIAAADVLTATFGSWQNYYFTLKKGTTDMITPKGNICSGDIDSKSYPIPTRAGTVTMKLDLC